jgi:hypothetical protein
MYSGRVRLHTGPVETHRREDGEADAVYFMSRIGVESGPTSGFRRIRDNDNGDRRCNSGPQIAEDPLITGVDAPRTGLEGNPFGLGRHSAYHDHRGAPTAPRWALGYQPGGSGRGAPSAPRPFT